MSDFHNYYLPLQRKDSLSHVGYPWLVNGISVVMVVLIMKLFLSTSGMEWSILIIGGPIITRYMHALIYYVACNIIFHVKTKLKMVFVPANLQFCNSYHSKNFEIQYSSNVILE